MSGCTLSQKLFNKKDIPMKTLIVLLPAVVISMVSIAVEVSKVTPQEIDQVVEEEVLLSLHPDDAQAAVDYLKGKGATNYLIADAVARSLRRNINSTKEEGWFKANAGIHWLEKLGDQNQISNLLYAAQVSTNIHASAAVRAFHRRLEDKGQFISIADGLLSRPGMDQLKSAVWGVLEEEAAGVQRDKVLALANDKLRDGLVNFYYADRILSRWQDEYAEGEMRRSLIKIAVGDPSFKTAFPAAHEALIKKLNVEIKR